MMYPNGGLYASFEEVMGSNHHNKLIGFYIHMTESAKVLLAHRGTKQTPRFSII